MAPVTATAPFLSRNTREPGEKHTHAITIPETTFLAFVTGEEAAAKLAKRLSATRIAPRKRAKPIVWPIADWRATHG